VPRFVQPASTGLPEPQDPVSRRLAVALAAISAAQLMEERADAMDYYLGDMRKDMPAQDGRSRAVSTDVADTIEGMVAAEAGIGPGMKIIAVNGRKFSADVLHDALKAAKANTLPIELLVENTEYYKTFKLNYHEGDKYPHLVRDDAKPDLLSAILKAK